jgi:hypothetical protein
MDPSEKSSKKVILPQDLRIEPEIIKNIIPKINFENNTICCKCINNNLIFSDNISNYCDKCILLIPQQFNCIKCNYEFTTTKKKYINKQKCCTKCFNKLELFFNCDYCKTLYVGTHKQINELNNKKICYNCVSDIKIINYYIHNFIDNESVKNLLKIYSDVKFISVTYKIINNINNIDDIDDIDDIGDDIITIKLPLYGLLYNVDDLMSNKDFMKLYYLNKNNDNNLITTIIDVNKI